MKIDTTDANTPAEQYSIISQRSLNSSDNAGVIINIQAEVIENKGLVFYSFGGHTTEFSTTNSTAQTDISNNKWTNVIVTYDDNTITTNIYINGIKHITQT